MQKHGDALEMKSECKGTLQRVPITNNSNWRQITYLKYLPSFKPRLVRLVSIPAKLEN